MKYGLITGLLWFFGILFVVRGITLIGESFTKDEVLTLEGINQVNANVRKLRDMMLRLVAARHRAWGVVDDSTT